ncbi:MAG: nuclear transport factor 2 family protein [Gammaproteobacteria bacterium]
MHNPATEIELLVTELCECWNRKDLQAIRALWDTEQATPHLMPQEKDQPIVSWPAFDEYLSEAQARLLRCSMRFWDLNVKPLGPDHAAALYQMHWNGEIRGFAKSLGIDSRVSAVFHRREDRWLICHYVEAPPAPMLHLQRSYAAAVDPDFLNRDHPAVAPPFTHEPK